MGQRGPAPTPTEILKLQGSKRAKEREGRHEPKDEVGLPCCPDWLDEIGRAEWQRLAPLLKKRRTANRPGASILAGLCANWSTFRQAQEQLQAELAKATPDVLVVRRWNTTANSAYLAYLKGAAEFGLSPSGRARVQALPEDKAGGVRCRNRNDANPCNGTALG